MEAVKDLNKKLYRCDVCKKVENWNDGWQWFGSDNDLDNGKPILYTCSDKCRESIKGFEANRLLKIKKRN